MKRILGGLLAASLLATACSPGALTPRNVASTSAAAAPTSAPAARAVLPALAPTTGPQPAAPVDASAATPKAAGAGGAQDASAAQEATAVHAAQPAAAPTPAEEPTPSSQPAPLERMIIYTTSLTLLVVNLPGAVSEVSAIATSLGGFVAGVEQHFQDEHPSAVVRLKVPADKYDEAMNRLRRDGVDARDEKTTTDDVTEEYNDLQNQLASLQATYNQYLELMKKAQTVDDVVKLQQRIDEVKLQLDRLKGRVSFLQRQSAFATVTVTLLPAQEVLMQEYSARLAQQRSLQMQQATLLIQIKQARTDEERNSLLDQLGQVKLRLDALAVTIAQIREKAQRASVVLPTPELGTAVDTSLAATSADDLARTYLDLRVEIRATELRRDVLQQQLQQTPPPANVDALRTDLKDAVLRLQALNERLQAVEDQAQRQHVTLPSVDSDLLAVLVGGQDSQRGLTRFWRSVTQAWEASLAMLSEVGIGLAQLLVFFWWLLPLLVLGLAVGRRSRLFRRSWRRPPVASPGESTG